MEEKASGTKINRERAKQFSKSFSEGEKPLEKIKQGWRIVKRKIFGTNK